MNRISILLFACAVSISVQAAKIRVNNRAGLSAAYTTFASAVTAAAVGDTLFIEGSPISYGTVTLSKNLTVVGPGYFLTQNDSTQAITFPATFDAMTVSSTGAGSTISGLTFIGAPVALLTISANNVTVSRNFFQQTTATASSTAIRISANINNTAILQNFFEVTTTTTAQPMAIEFLTGPQSNTIISNNLIMAGSPPSTTTTHSTATTKRAIVMPTNANAVISNNTIIGDMVLYNSTVVDNILIRGNLTTSASFPINSQFNMGGLTQWGTANSNQINVNMTTMFAQTGLVTQDRYWLLSGGSSANGTSSTGSNRGATGGTMPYKLSGIPPFPAVWSATVPPTGSASSNLNVNVKAKAHR
jgi:hypothetical protein